MTWVKAMDLSDLESGAQRVDIGDHRIAVFKVDDAVYAIGDRCSHAEASLSEGEVDDLEVECPRHGAIFALDSGDALSLPASKPVPSYDVRVSDDVVFLALESA